MRATTRAMTRETRAMMRPVRPSGARKTEGIKVRVVELRLGRRRRKW
jgi:hypothetical protein